MQQMCKSDAASSLWNKRRGAAVFLQAFHGNVFHLNNHHANRYNVFMLSIYFGEMEHAAYGPTWFKFNYDPAWFRDPFVQEMMEDVDHSRFITGEIIESDVLGPIAPERLSGGLQTLILIYERTDMVFDATSCGENCARWLLEIGRKKDVTVNLNYLMMFDDEMPFEIMILNNHTAVHNAKEYLLAALYALYPPQNSSDSSSKQQVFGENNRIDRGRKE